MGGFSILGALVQDLVSLVDPGADLLLPGKARRVVQIPDDASVLEMQLRREITRSACRGNVLQCRWFRGRKFKDRDDAASAAPRSGTRRELAGFAAQSPRLLAAVGLGVGLGKLRAEQEYLR